MRAEDRVSIARGARRALGRRSFRWFFDHTWDTFEPTRKILPSVAVDGVCAALQAVADRRILRLGIAQPPGTSKSLSAAVAFPAYVELKSDGRERVMVGSYSHHFAERDATKCRDLIKSPIYGELAAGVWGVRKDVGDRIDDVWFTGGGRRVIVSPDGRSMGERCTIQIIDDPLSSRDVYSEAAKTRATRWVSQELPSRLEDQDADRRVLVMQRLCLDDPFAWAKERGWRTLELPALLGPLPDEMAERYPDLAGLVGDGDYRCRLLDDAGGLVWEDQREPGEPLSSLLDVHALDALRIDMGSTVFSAQYLQRPQDDSGSMFKRAWFERRWSQRDLPEEFDRVVISLDASFKVGDDNDFAVLQAWGAIGGDRYLLEQWRRREGAHETLLALRAMYDRWPIAKVVIEEAANGHAVWDFFHREVSAVVAVTPEGGKMSRAATVVPICESGSVVLPADAPWVTEWIEEICGSSKHDDQLDAMVYGLRELVGRSWPDYRKL